MGLLGWLQTGPWCGKDAGMGWNQPHPWKLSFQTWDQVP